MSVKSIQAPISGINRLVSIDDMSESEAWILDNWIPGAGDCRIRGGSAVTSIDFSGDSIGTIITYGSQLIVAAGGILYDTGLTPDHLINPPSPLDVLGSGFSNDAWQWEVFNNKLLLVNGVDAPQQYDGTTLSPIDFTGSDAGLNPEEFIGVNSFKGRVIYWKKEPSFYYAEAGSYAGVITEFDLSIWVERLSSTNTMFTWSADAGDGPDDFFVVIMSSGEALVYQGTDPSSLDYFALVGKYAMGVPLSYRATTSISGDALILTHEGWQNFKAIWDTGNFRDSGIGQKMSGLAVPAAELFGTQSGWEAHYYPEEKMVLVNVPQGSGVSIQHIMNTNTMAWATFSGWSATTFGEYQGRIYYGTSDGKLIIAMEGASDQDQAITTDAIPAFTYLSGRANTKMLTGVKPVTTIANPDTIGLVGAADFDIPNPYPADYVPQISNPTPWGSAWGSSWSGVVTNKAVSQWESVNAHGYCVTYRMTTKTTGEMLQWGSTQLMYRDAGVI